MADNPLIEIADVIRLAPVADPRGRLTGGHPLLDRYVDLEKIANSSMMRALLIAAYPRIRESVLPTALDGGCCLLADGSLVIEPHCCGDLGDLSSWESMAALGAQSGPLTAPEPEWRKFWIGHPALLAKPHGEHVWLAIHDEAADNGLPCRGEPIWTVRRADLARAASAARRIVTGLWACVDQALDGLIDDDLHDLAVDWILNGEGSYQTTAAARQSSKA